MANTIINTPELLNLDSTTGATILAKGTVNQRPPSPGFSLDYLVVAGGGGASGGTYNGQGGGGGGYLTGTLSISIGNSHTLTVGDGGASTNNGAGTNGDNSVFSSIISPGGGGGGAGSASTGGNGGSGGAGSIQGGTGSAGFNGGVGDGISGWVAGGGGGAAAVGGSITGAGNTWYAGDGGNGATPSIITAAQATTVGIGEVVNNVLYLAGGGAGGGYNYSGYAFNPGSGGLGGGGNGSSSTNGTDGLANTGGGGGGGNSRTSATGGQGGSGVVVLKYPTAYTITVGSGITEASGSPFADGSGNTISVYTSGTGTISFSGTVVGGDNDATDGALRFNTETNKTEYFDGANWYEIVDEYASGFIGPATNYFDTKLYTGNGATQSIGGYINGSASFNGSSSFIALGTNSPLNNFNGEQTISAWIYPTTAIQQSIIGYRDDSTLKWNYLRVNSNRTLAFLLRNGSSSSAPFTTGLVNLNAWNHICVTVNSSNIIFYVNGGTAESFSNTVSSFTSTEPTDIGRRGSYSDQYFNGSIDQVRIYNTALSSSDVTALYGETAATATTAAYPSGQTAIATYTMDTSANGLLNTQDLSTVDYPSGAGCVALYEMNGNSNDTSNTYNGTPTDISYQGGAFDQAAVFNGSSSYIDLGTSLLGSKSAFSVSTWVNFDNLNTQNFIFYNSESGTGGNVGFYDFGNGSIYFQPDASTSANRGYISNSGIYTTDEWVHIVMVFDGSATGNSNRLKAYIQGTERTLTYDGTIPSSTGTSTANTWIGGRSSTKFSGDIDQVRIFNTALTQSQVTTLARGIATSYSGTATNVNFNGHLNFAPDLVWIKRRNLAANHRILDSVRGNDLEIFPNLTNAESNFTTLNWDFEANGFSFNTNDASYNVSGGTYVGWCWKAGGAAVANNEGTIATQVSANKDSGFSIVKYTGNATSGATIGHGLGVKPDLVFFKNLDHGSNYNWTVYSNTTATGATGLLYLNLNAAFTTTSSRFNNTEPDDSVITLGNDPTINDGGDEHIAYCWHSVAGYSKIGIYTGNASSTGPIVTTGFEPKFIMIKRTDTSGYGWYIMDSARGMDGITGKFLFADTSASEGTLGAGGLQPNSTGFQITDAGAGFNANLGTYIYMAFA